MRNIVFMRPRHDYKPYHDLYTVASLSGFPVLYTDQVNWQDPSLVVVGTPKCPEWIGIPAQKRAHLVWWQFERGHTEEPLWDMSNPYVPDCVNETWTSDGAYAREHGVRYVFLGGHRAFGSINILAKTYDYITLMANFGRRVWLFAALDELRMIGADVPGGTWEADRHERLMRSKLMISCHQDDKPYCEPIRFMIAASYAIPLLSEQCADSGFYVAGEHYGTALFKDLPGFASLLMKNEVIMRRTAANAWRLACVDHPFDKEVRLAVG